MMAFKARAAGRNATEVGPHGPPWQGQVASVAFVTLIIDTHRRYV